MKRLSTRKTLSILLTFSLFGSLLSACNREEVTGTGNVTDSNNSNNGMDGISGSIVVGGWPSGDDAFEAALDGFYSAHPNIEVELQFTDTTSHHQALQTSLAAGSDAQDVVMIEGAYIAQYRDSTALVNLLDEPYNAEELRGDFVSYKWEQGYSVDDTRMVTIPWDIGPASYFYRRDIFEEVGLPSDPDEVTELMSTWEGVLQVAEAVHIPGQRWLLPDASYLYFLLFCNRDYYDENLDLVIERDGDIATLNAAIEMRSNAWDMNVDMWSTEANAAFADGSLVSVATGAWYGGFLKNDIDPEGSGNWGVTVLPGGIPSSNWGGSFLAIPEQSTEKDAAWAFIEYMLATTEGQNDMFAAVDYYPAYMPAWEDDAIYEQADSYFGGQQTKLLWAEIAADLRPVITTMMDTSAEGTIYSSVNSGLDAGLSAEEIRDLVAENIEIATSEVRQQQIQVYRDAGLWDE